MERGEAAGRAHMSTSCKVEGCNADMTAERPYYRRYSVCEAHIRALQVQHAGKTQRFCQQCGKFQELVDFDGDKRSCRTQLAKHSARRRLKLAARRQQREQERQQRLRQQDQDGGGSAAGACGGGDGSDAADEDDEGTEHHSEDEHRADGGSTAGAAAAGGAAATAGRRGDESDDGSMDEDHGGLASYDGAAARGRRHKASARDKAAAAAAPAAAAAAAAAAEAEVAEAGTRRAGARGAAGRNRSSKSRRGAEPPGTARPSAEGKIDSKPAAEGGASGMSAAAAATTAPELRLARQGTRNRQARAAALAAVAAMAQVGQSSSSSSGGSSSDDADSSAEEEQQQQPSATRRRVAAAVQSPRARARAPQAPQAPPPPSAVTAAAAIPPMSIKRELADAAEESYAAAKNAQGGLRSGSAGAASPDVDEPTAAPRLMTAGLAIAAGTEVAAGSRPQQHVAASAAAGQQPAQGHGGGAAAAAAVETSADSADAAAEAAARPARDDAQQQQAHGGHGAAVVAVKEEPQQQPQSRFGPDVEREDGGGGGGDEMEVDGAAGATATGAAGEDAGGMGEDASRKVQGGASPFHSQQQQQQQQLREVRTAAASSGGRGGGVAGSGGGGMSEHDVRLRLLGRLSSGAGTAPAATSSHPHPAPGLHLQPTQTTPMLAALGSAAAAAPEATRSLADIGAAVRKRAAEQLRRYQQQERQQPLKASEQLQQQQQFNSAPGFGRGSRTSYEAASVAGGSMSCGTVMGSAATSGALYSALPDDLQLDLEINSMLVELAAEQVLMGQQRQQQRLRQMQQERLLAHQQQQQQRQPRHVQPPLQPLLQQPSAHQPLSSGASDMEVSQTLSMEPAVGNITPSPAAAIALALRGAGSSASGAADAVGGLPVAALTARLPTLPTSLIASPPASHQRLQTQLQAHGITLHLGALASPPPAAAAGGAGDASGASGGGGGTSGGSARDVRQQLQQQLGSAAAALMRQLPRDAPAHTRNASSPHGTGGSFAGQGASASASIVAAASGSIIMPVTAGGLSSAGESSGYAQLMGSNLTSGPLLATKPVGGMSSAPAGFVRDARMSGLADISAFTGSAVGAVGGGVGHPPRWGSAGDAVPVEAATAIPGMGRSSGGVDGSRAHTSTAGGAGGGGGGGGHGLVPERLDWRSLAASGAMAPSSLGGGGISNSLGASMGQRPASDGAAVFPLSLMRGGSSGGGSLTALGSAPGGARGGGSGLSAGGSAATADGSGGGVMGPAGGRPGTRVELLQLDAVAAARQPAAEAGAGFGSMILCELGATGGGDEGGGSGSFAGLTAYRQAAGGGVHGSGARTSWLSGGVLAMDTDDGEGVPGGRAVAGATDTRRGSGYGTDGVGSGAAGRMALQLQQQLEQYGQQHGLPQDGAAPVGLRMQSRPQPQMQMQMLQRQALPTPESSAAPGSVAPAAGSVPPFNSDPGTSNNIRRQMQLQLQLHQLAQQAQHDQAVQQRAMQVQQAQQAQRRQAQLQQMQLRQAWQMQQQQAQQQQAQLAQQAAAQQPMPWELEAALVQRFSIKMYGCSPEDLMPDAREQLEAWLRSQGLHVLQASARSGCVHIVADVVRMPPQQLAPAADTAAEAAMAGRDPPGEPHGDAVGAGRSSSEGLYELLGGLVLQPGMAGSSSQWQGDGGGCRSDGTSAGGDQRISSRSGRAVLDLLQGLLGPRLGQKDTKPGSGSATHARPAGADYEQQVAAGRVELQLGSQVIALTLRQLLQAAAEVAKRPAGGPPLQQMQQQRGCE